MHIPDGLISPTAAIIGFIITIVFWIVCFKKVKLSEQQVPMMGLLTALFFAAMMLNFPIVGGTTAHFLGGAIIGLILGPFAGLISMSIILVLQAFLFGDGGLIVLGVNVLNLGIIGVFVPCIVFLALNKLFKPKIGLGLSAIIFFSAFLSVFCSALAAGTTIGLSTLSLYGLSVTVPAMVLSHSIIGVAEGLGTVFLIWILLKLRPDVLEKSPILGKLSLFQNKPQSQETPNVKA